MTPRHQVSRAAVTLIKRFEGFRAKAAELDDGRWTIGYGHTKTARAHTEIPEADAEALLLYDLINVAHVVNEWTYAPLNQNQFDALVSFAFNIGLENFRRSTTLRRINEGRVLEAALAMELWRRADFEGERIVVDALVRRRAAEKMLFLTPVDAWAPAPSPVLPPKIDYDVAPFTLTSTPAVLKTDLTGQRAVAERSDPPVLIPVEDTGPTATELAAAAVSVRLGALAPEAASHAPALDAPAPKAAVQEPVGQEVDPDATAEEQSVPIAETAEEALAFPERQEAPRDIDTIPSHATAAVDTPAEGAPEVAKPDTPLTLDAKPAARPQLISLLVWIAILFLGFALFSAAVKWGFRPASPPILGMDPVMASWIVGVLGIGLAAPAVYFLMARIGGRDEP